MLPTPAMYRAHAQDTWGCTGLVRDGPCRQQAISPQQDIRHWLLHAAASALTSPSVSCVRRRKAAS